MSTSPHIIEPTEQSFTADVIERSVKTPVVVDFWAPWCGPCRHLTPVLEQLAAEFDGKFLLAKVNTEERPGLAAAFQVQSIPTVVAIRDRQLFDLFQGALPEEAVREWLARVLPSRVEELVAAASACEVDDLVQAESLYRDALAEAADEATARIGLARVLVVQHRLDEAAEVVDALEARGFLEPEAEKVRSQLHVLQAAGEGGGINELRQQAAADPDNLELQVQFAEGLAAAGQVREGLEACLQVVSRDRTGAGDQAKTAMLDILNTLDDPDLASEYRRKLATLLY